jgi:hypothetical protein
MRVWPMMIVPLLVLCAVSSARGDESPQLPFQSLPHSLPLRTRLLPSVAANIDQCTNSYNLCVSSCSNQQSQCSSRGNSGDYCDAAYRSCALACENHMHACWGQ